MSSSETDFKKEVEEFESAETWMFIIYFVALSGLLMVMVGVMFFILRNPPRIRSHCLGDSGFIPLWEPYGSNQ